MLYISVKEYEKIIIRDTRDVNNKIISKKDLIYLYEIERRLGKRLFIYGNNYITPVQWVGIITTPTITFELKPKLNYESNQKKIDLERMIKVAYDLPYKIKINGNHGINKNGLIDIIIALFLDMLEREIKVGLYREYIKTEENINRIKGRINFSKSIKTNAFRKDKFYCTYSKFSLDNKINRIIKFTLNNIIHFVINNQLRKKINTLIGYFDETANESITLKDIDSIRYGRKNTKYKPIIDVCKYILEHCSVGMEAGEVNLNYWLFDMNILFERYIYKSLKKAINYPIKYQYSNNILLKNQQNNDKKFLRLKPDMYIMIDENRSIIIDTKWKELESSLNAPDIYQMTSYLVSFEDVKTAIILLPHTEKNEKIIGDYQINTVYFDKKILIRTIDLSIMPTRVFYNNLTNIILRVVSPEL
ncbi:McrC family protein [Vallitalea guaymasensis]|uniref:McrC family protein n=1 Tax=Vallitalea guaymasensis TaxID=1185412 RepID=UPI00235382A8|nr:hypothetical protein [Vallitalea guaymasensis]